MRILTLFVFAVLIGCGQPGTSGDGGGAGGGAGGGIGAALDREELSGTRLKARYIQGEDGSRTAYGFFDSTRNDPCVFMTAEDGRERCLPPDAATVGALYTDSACTHRLASDPQKCGTLKYAIEYLPTCPATRAVYSATRFAASTQVFAGGPASCSPTSFGIPSGDLYTAVAKISADSFVAGDLKTEP